MVSVRLQEIGSEVVHRVSLKKLSYTIVSQPSEQAKDVLGVDTISDHQTSIADGHAQRQQPGGEEDRDGDRQQSPAACAASQQQEEQQEGVIDDSAVLDAFPRSTAAAIEQFAAAIEADPSAFLQPTPELVSLAKSATKALYDYQAALDSGSTPSAGAAAAVLPELYVDGFDAEQIWLQLELAMGPSLKRARRLLKKAGQEPQMMTPEMEDAIEELLQDAGLQVEDEGEAGEGGTDEQLTTSGESDDGVEEGEENADVAADDLGNVDYDALLAAGAAQRRKGTSASSDSELDEETEEPVRLKRKRATVAGAAARAAVEDEHFKLDEMEAFVQQAEREAAGLRDEMKEGEDQDDTDSDDEEAKLEALLHRAAAQVERSKKKAKRKGQKAAEEGGEMQDDEENIGATAMYEDFFGPRSGRSQMPALVAAGGARQGRLNADEEEDDQDSDDQDADDFRDDMLSDDMLSGEEDEDAERRHQGDLDGNQPAGSSDEGELDSDLEGDTRDLLADSGAEDEADAELVPSGHEKRQQRLQEKIRRLEEAAIGEKDWFMLGEVDAGRRPKNSALEIDLDFETTVKPPPQPTEEMTKTLDELIKGRIAEGRFDDVVRIVAAPLETKRSTLELDDSKPQQGLGELYEQEYMQAVTGAVDDKDEEVRQQARAQFSALCAKLDALSHLHFTPRPVIEEVTVKVDVPAIMMEEAAPQFVSSASMRAPEEVFAAAAAGTPRAEGELTKEDRKRRRAQKKRAGKKRRAAKDEERAGRAAAEGRPVRVAGRKSEAAAEAARKLEKKSKGGSRNSKSGSKKSEFSKSAAVFAKIQQHAEGQGASAAATAAAVPKPQHLKL